MKLLYFSNVNWNWIKQRPHFIPLYLSKHGIDVTFLSLTPLGKQKKNKEEVIGEKLIIKDKYVIPFSRKFEFINKLNNILFVNKELNNDFDYILLTHPYQYNFLDKITPKKRRHLIYECMDNMPFFYSEKYREKIYKLEKKLCLESDSIIVSSNYIKNRFIKEYNISREKITVIKNGVDISFCHKVPEKIDLKYPNLIYIGTISEWIDFETLDYFAINNPEYTIYMVGPVDNLVQNKTSKLSNNIIFVGKLEHEEIKKYIYSGDIMIIPFIINDLIKGVDPVKIYEYLAFNKNVISSYWEELNFYKENPNVKFYKNQEEFCKIIKDGVISTISSRNEEFIFENSWEKRVEDYIVILKSVNRGKLAQKKHIR